MLSQALRARLADPAYLDLHLVAASVLRDIRKVPWYDAHFLRRFAAARQYLEIVKPEASEQFSAEFARLQPPEDFSPIKLDQLFSDEIHQRIRDTVAAIPRGALKDYETSDFGRLIFHDQPYFLELQSELVPLVSKLVGHQVETGYNFLSLYGGSGKCDPHMDEPMSMYTLDFCIDQNVDWPINFSQIVDWPEMEGLADWHPRQLLQDPSMSFSAHDLNPGEALIFAGSSQWHYRDAIPAGGYSNLLFLHYYPAGTHDLVNFEHWPRHFGIPELGPLCDLIAETSVNSGQ